VTPGLELGESPSQFARRRPNERPDLRRQIPSRTDRQAAHGIDEQALELGVVINLRLEEEQRRRGTFLSAMAERRVQDMLDGLLPVGQGGDDRGILAAGFREEAQPGTGAQQVQRCAGAPGQDHRIHAGMRHEALARSAAGAGEELQGFVGHAGAPETLAQFPGHQHRIAGWLENDGISGGERRSHAAGGNGDGKIPGRHDHDHTQSPRLDRGQFEKLPRRGAVKLREIHRLRDFRIGFGQNLAAIGQGRPHQLAAGLADFRGHLAKDVQASVVTESPPARGIAIRLGDRAFDVFVGGQGVSRDFDAGS